MAEAAVSYVLQLLGDKLIQEATFLYGVRDQGESIQRELMRMKCFLKDADSKGKGDERVRNWVREIRDVAYEADDLIDTFILKTARRRRRMGFFIRYALFFNELILRSKVGKEIKGIKLKIRQISESMSTYGITSIDEVGETSVVNKGLRERRHTSPLLNEPHIIGLEEDTEKLVGRLLEQQPRRCVISIVGMGGLGKTTLAKKIYSKSDVKSHFECRAWVCVSQQYKIDEILGDIAKDAMGISKHESENMNRSDLEEKLNTFLNEKRYLVVVDDIWNTQAWDDLKQSLPDGMNGSRVLLTTRIRDVALYADPASPPHMLCLLGHTESWELFLKVVFPTKNNIVANCPPELEAVGKEIVARCGGLPLAIVVMGGVLSVKEKSESAWLKVHHTVNWQLSQGPNKYSEILALSYNDLPHHLKSCFLYFGLFPEDCAIPGKELIHMWVAEGFVQVRGEETLEEAAEECMEELIQRSMIQAKRRIITGSVKTCHIHDLMRELAISKGKEDSFLDTYDEEDVVSPTRARRLAIHRSIKCYNFLNYSTPHLRTLLCFSELRGYLDKGDWIHFEGLKLLRVLELNDVVNADVVAKGINNLIHLRYLKWPNTTRLFTINVSNLHNLQTLDLRGHRTDRECYICSSIWKMKQLRHVYLNSGIRIDPPQQADEDDVCVGNLQTLKYIEGFSYWMLTDYLVKLTSLRKLGIEGHVIQAMNERGLADSSITLKSMRSLSWCGGDRSHLRMMLSWYPHLRKLKLEGTLHKLPDNHEFPQQLVKLSLSRTELNEDPMATLEKLPNLQFLFLEESYDRFWPWGMVCSAGGFPRLEYLTLHGENWLMEWGVEEGAMPSLRYLKIDGCRYLEMLPEGLRGLTNLSQLFISSMPREFNARLRQDEGADWDKIKHIPSITIEDYISS